MSVLVIASLSVFFAEAVHKLLLRSRAEEAPFEGPRRHNPSSARPAGQAARPADTNGTALHRQEAIHRHSIISKVVPQGGVVRQRWRANGLGAGTAATSAALPHDAARFHFGTGRNGKVATCCGNVAGSRSTQGGGRGRRSESVAGTCGRDLWSESVAGTCGRNLWSEPVAGICGRNLWPEPVVGTCGRNLWPESVVGIFGRNLW